MHDDRDPALIPFGGVAFAALLAGVMSQPPRLGRPSAPPVKRRNPKRLAQKAKRAARKASRRSK